MRLLFLVLVLLSVFDIVVRSIEEYTGNSIDFETELDSHCVDRDLVDMDYCVMVLGLELVEELVVLVV
jgi:hypothetical protein